MLKNLFRGLAASAFIGLICGCGGSSGYGLSISEQNAEPLSGQAVEASDVVSDMSDLVEDYIGLIESEDAQLALCADGNVILDINDVGEQGVVSTGDSVSITFQACDVGGFGIIFNGTLSFTATDVSGTPGAAFSRVLDVEINAFSITAGNASIVVNGSFTLELSSTDGVTVMASASGPSLSAFASGNQGAFSGTISNFVFETTVNTETEAYTVMWQATLSGSEIGGTVTFETTTPFTGSGDDDPENGTFIITAPDGSNATLVALGEGAVQLLLDIDGDNEIEITINTTWDVINDEDANGSEL